MLTFEIDEHRTRLSTRPHDYRPVAKVSRLWAWSKCQVSAANCDLDLHLGVIFIAHLEGVTRFINSTFQPLNLGVGPKLATEPTESAEFFHLVEQIPYGVGHNRTLSATFNSPNSLKQLFSFGFCASHSYRGVD